MQNIGLITATDRETLHLTAEAVGLLPVPECPQFAVACQHLAQAATARRDTIADMMLLAGRVQQALMAEASPDRWLPDLDAMGVPTGQAMDIVADLINERTGQAKAVKDVRDLCARIMVRMTVVEPEIA